MVIGIDLHWFKKPVLSQTKQHIVAETIAVKAGKIEIKTTGYRRTRGKNVSSPCVNFKWILRGQGCQGGHQVQVGCVGIDCLAFEFILEQSMDVELTISGLQGNVIVARKVNMSSGLNSFNIDIKDFSAGSYVYKISTKNFTNSGVFIKL